MAVPERKRKIKVKSKSVSNGEEGCSKAESVKNKRFKRKPKKEKRDRRKKKYLNPDSPIPYRKPNSAFLKVEKPEKPVKPLDPLFSEWAELALAEYEKNQGAEFKLVRVVAPCCRFLPFFDNVPWGWYCHIFFKAVPINVVNSNDDSSAKTFFAELFFPPEKIVVNACCIMEPDDPGRKLGCGICPADERFPHPQSGFIAGHFPYQPPFSSSDQFPKPYDPLTGKGGY